MRELSGQGSKDLQEALLSAFPSRHNLSQMLRFKLNVSLDIVASESNHGSAVFTLIRWAVSTGRLKELIIGASTENPNNSDLKAFCKKYASILSLPEVKVEPIEPPIPQPTPSVPLVTQVTGWKTTDGKFHENESNAERHQRYLNRQSTITQWLLSKYPVQSNEQREIVTDIGDIITENLPEFLELTQ
jgi:hypothetical protein